MWSLYKRKEENCGIGAGLFNYTGEKLKPLKFSNGKTQEDIVLEVLDAIKQGHKTIFIKGVCGTGKSAIALNIAKNFKKSAIVVPIKSLQEQYEVDYTREKFVLKDGGNPLSISVIKGRNNFRCPLTSDRCDDDTLPCTIEIRDSNTEQLMKYLEMNKNVDGSDFSEAADIKRMNIAPACPYWSPLMISDANPKGLDGFEKKKYMAVCGKEYALFKRKKGCGYYDQMASYIDSDVLIFNSRKYSIENQIGRKPRTDIDIIDECDEFLDNFANERKINLNRLQTALNNLTPKDSEIRRALKDLIFEINSLIFNPPKIEVEKLKNSKLRNLFDKILENPYLAEEEESNYYNSVLEIVRTFESLIDETYISVDVLKKGSSQKGLFDSNFKSGEDSVVLTLVSINLAQRLKELVDMTEVIVMMSGTLHSEEVLRDVFGLSEFKIIEAETENPGHINKYRTGLEMNCSFSNFSSGSITRKQYLKIMDVCMANSKPPTLVHVSAFKDLPTEEENATYKFDNLITQEKLSEIQKRGNSAVEDFSNKEIDILFTTKCSRGVDFAGDKCNSIVVTRFPYPNIQGLFWKILKKEQPEKFMEFYMDKARRELIQKVSRGVRFKGDKVDLLSPDVRVLNATLE